MFLDEVQEVKGFEKIVNGLNKRDNVDVYITGSNSKFLSSDINTLFRGRGDEVRVYPLSFKEFCTNREEPINELWKEYYTFGGMRNGKQQFIQYEVDFIANNGTDKYYIQSAYSLPDEDKRQQELASLKRIDDSFKKIIIVADDIATYTDENGFVFMGLFQFLNNGGI